MTVPKMMNTADGHITADGGDTGRLPQKIEKNFLIGLRETHPALPVLSADAVRAGAPVRRADGRLVLRVPPADGKTAVLCDFYRAGYTGSAYKTWLTIE